MSEPTRLDGDLHVKGNLRVDGKGGLPEVTEADNGMVLGVEDGEWAVVEGGGGGGDFSTATLTIANNVETSFNVTVTGVRVSSGEMAYYPESFGNLYSTEWDVVLYSGAAGIVFAAGSNMHLTVTGDITVDDNDTDMPYVTVSGDGTISITLAD